MRSRTVTLSKGTVLVVQVPDLSISHVSLIAIRYQIEQPKNGQCERTSQSLVPDKSKNNVIPKVKRNHQTLQLVTAFPNLFRRRGRIKITKKSVCKTRQTFH